MDIYAKHYFRSACEQAFDLNSATNRMVKNSQNSNPIILSKDEETRARKTIQYLDQSISDLKRLLPDEYKNNAL